MLLEKIPLSGISARLKKNELPFAGVTELGSAEFRFHKPSFYAGIALHARSKVRPELIEKMAVSKSERYRDEDPYTDLFIRNFPIQIIACDSRFEYDLNRDPESCIYEEAWNKNVWKKKLSKADKELSLKKHRNYYRVTEALIRKLESEFDGCVVYDMHSYNWKRWDRKVPVFNIGSENVDNKKFGK